MMTLMTLSFLVMKDGAEEGDDDALVVVVVVGLKKKQEKRQSMPVSGVNPRLDQHDLSMIMMRQEQEILLERLSWLTLESFVVWISKQDSWEINLMVCLVLFDLMIMKLGVVFASQVFPAEEAATRGDQKESVYMSQPVSFFWSFF